MARTKASTHKPRSAIEQERYTAELSTGQLVIGICILLMFGLGCFLFGLVVGKFDPTLEPGTVTQQASQPLSEPIGEALTSAEPAQARPTATPPPPEMRVPPKGTTPAKVPEIKDSKPKSTTVASRPKPKAEPVKASKAVEAVAEKNRLAPAGVTPTSIATPPTPNPKVDREPQKTATTTAPAKPERVVPRTQFGVQIAALQTRQRANVAKREIEAKSSYQATIIKSKSGRLFKVVVGSYADRATVNKVRDDLRTRYRYQDCFVTTL